MTTLSLIIPVFNRPGEVDELLSSLQQQTHKDFDVIIVEDGSTIPCLDICRNYESALRIRYIAKENSGPSASRNLGVEHSASEYVVFLDSDCICPPGYITALITAISTLNPDCFGGPDAAHDSFTVLQKAINYSMTSLLTTGGIRGKAKGMEKFHPRSFNMGFKTSVFRQLGGFGNLRFGEDIDLSIRVRSAGYQSHLIEKAFVYHKRRTDLRKFFRQVFNSGLARVHLGLIHPGTTKVVHLLPSIVVVFALTLVLTSVVAPIILILPILGTLALFTDSLRSSKDLAVALWSVPASMTQTFGYGLGYLYGQWVRVSGRGSLRGAFVRTFYK